MGLDNPGRTMSEELLDDGRKFADWVRNSPDELAAHNPFSAGLNYEILEVGPGVGYAKIQFAPGEAFTNFLKVVHGGVVASMIDETASIAAMTLIGWFFRGTVGANVSFIAPLRPGYGLCEARVLGHSRSLVFLDAQLRSESGSLCAHAAITVSYAPPKETLAPARQ